MSLSSILIQLIDPPQVWAYLSLPFNSAFILAGSLMKITNIIVGLFIVKFLGPLIYLHWNSEKGCFFYITKFPQSSDSEKGCFLYIKTRSKSWISWLWDVSKKNYFTFQQNKVGGMVRKVFRIVCVKCLFLRGICLDKG